MTDLVTVADAGHVRTITLNRPDKKNALSTDLAWAVVGAVDEAAAIDNVRVIAITGSGDSFCGALTGSPPQARPRPASPPSPSPASSGVVCRPPDSPSRSTLATVASASVWKPASPGSRRSSRPCPRSPYSARGSPGPRWRGRFAGWA